MAVTSVVVIAPWANSLLPGGPGGILQPGSYVGWIGGTGPFNVLHEWDKVNTFDSVDLIQDSNTGVTSPDAGAPGANLGPIGTQWFFRVTVTDTSDATNMVSSVVTLNWFDQRLKSRFHYLLPNVGVGFHPENTPGGGWGVGGTQGPDGDTRLLSRFDYLLPNVGVGFNPTDTPVGGWGVPIGGLAAGGDGDARLDNRYHYLMPNLTTALPSPYLFSLSPNFGRPGDSFTAFGWGLMPYEDWAEGITATISGWSPSGGAGQFTDGHLPVQSGEDRPDVGWIDGGTIDPVITIDLGTPRMINEVRVWYRLADPFVSVVVAWADGSGGPWTSIGTMTPGTHGDGSGFATLQAWSANADYGTHRYWRFTFTDVNSIGEIEVNRRMTIGTGDIEPRFDDTATDWLLAVSQQFYDQIVAQSPATTELGGEVRVENVFPDPDLVSNEKGYTFQEAISAAGTGVLVKVYDRDAPEQLLAIAGDTHDVKFHLLLSGVGSAEFTVPKGAPFFEEPGVRTKYNVTRIFLDQVERWWGFISFSEETLVDSQGRAVEAVRFFCKHGMSYLSRGVLFPKNWPSIEDPTWEFVEVTPGTILIDLITVIKARGTLPRLTYDFTATHDSAGVAWEDKLTLEFQAGTKLDRVVAQLVALGVDIRMDSQFRFQAFNQMGHDLPSTPDYQPMIVGHTVEALSEAEDFENPANVALISYGAIGQYLAYNDPVSIAEWERFEGFSQTSADNATTAQRLAEVAVERQGQPLDQIAIAIQRIRGEMEPFVDFNLGDTVRILSRAPQHAGFDKKYRVRAIAVDAQDVRNPVFVLDVNSIRIEKIIEHEIKLQLQQQNTLPVDVGSSVPGGAAPRDHRHQFPANGDVEGFTDDPTVTGWQGVPIDDGPFFNGDMWYFNLAANEWRLVSGTKATGRIPTIQGDGTVGWQSGAGVGPRFTLPLVVDSGAVAWTNMPAAVTFYNGSHRQVLRADLSDFTECRLVVNKQAVAGAFSSKLILRYRTTFSTTVGDYSNIGTSEVSVGVNVTDSVLVSSWVPLAAPAKADVCVALVGTSGDGVADPQFGSIVAQFR